MRLPGFGVQHTPLLVAAAASNALVAVALVRVAPTAAILIALVPLLVILAPALTTQTSRAILFSAALALGLFVPWLDRSFALGGANIHTQDLIVLFALAGWLLSKLLDTSALPVPRTPVARLGIPVPRRRPSPSRPSGATTSTARASSANPFASCSMPGSA